MTARRIQAQWHIREGVRTARLEPGLMLLTTNRRTDRGWGPVRWLVAHDELGTVAKGETWQSPDYASLVRQAMLEAELAAAAYLEGGAQ